MSDRKRSIADFLGLTTPGEQPPTREMNPTSAVTPSPSVMPTAMPGEIFDPYARSARPARTSPSPLPPPIPTPVPGRSPERTVDADVASAPTRRSSAVVMGLLVAAAATIAGLELLVDSATAPLFTTADEPSWPLGAILGAVLLGLGLGGLVKVHPLVASIVTGVWALVLWSSGAEGFRGFFSDAPIGRDRIAHLGVNGLTVVAGAAVLVGAAAWLARALGTASGLAEAVRIRSMRVRTEEQAGGADRLASAENAARTAPPDPRAPTILSALAGMAFAGLTLLQIGTESLAPAASVAEMPTTTTLALGCISGILIASAANNSAGYWAAFLLLIATYMVASPEWDQIGRHLARTEWWPAVEFALTRRTGIVLAGFLYAATAVIDGARRHSHSGLVGVAKGR